MDELKKKWIVPVIIIAVIACAGIFIAVKITALFGADKDFGLSSVSDIANQSAEFQAYVGEKEFSEAKLQEFKSLVDVVNANANLTNEIKKSFGPKFFVYIYSVAELKGIKFKVAEWSAEFTDGSVTKYQQGRLFNQVDETHIIVWIDHPTLMYMVQNQVGTSEVLDMVSNAKIKISPGGVTFKVVGLLPELLKVLA